MRRKHLSKNVLNVFKSFCKFSSKFLETSPESLDNSFFQKFYWRFSKFYSLTYPHLFTCYPKFSTTYLNKFLKFVKLYSKFLKNFLLFKQIFFKILWWFFHLMSSKILFKFLQMVLIWQSNFKQFFRLLTEKLQAKKYLPFTSKFFGYFFNLRWNSPRNFRIFPLSCLSA